MKLRIKGNSVRIRLTKSEVIKIFEEGYLQEETKFLQGRFIYALQSSAEIKTLSAAIADNKITMYVPGDFVKDWSENNVVGCSGNIRVSENENLLLLLEKDFVCLDTTTEDQSDNYSNPKQTC